MVSRGRRSASLIKKEELENKKGSLKKEEGLRKLTYNYSKLVNSLSSNSLSIRRLILSDRVSIAYSST